MMELKALFVKDQFLRLLNNNCTLLGRLNRRLQNRGLHVERGPDPLITFLDALEISLVLDVGANVGQYARNLRLLGYSQRIVSFEPSTLAFERLVKASRPDKKRALLKLALSDSDGDAFLNVYRNSALNSLLSLQDLGLWNEGQPSCESIATARLDRIFNDVATAEDRVFLKIDTQGSERAVLDGATAVFDRIAGLQIEVSFRPLYDKEPLMPEMVQYLEQRGFSLIYMLPLHHMLSSARRLKSPELVMQADAIFLRL